MKLKDNFGFTDIYLISEPDKDHNAAHWFTEYKTEVMEATDEDLKYFLDTVIGNIDDIWGGAPIEVAIKEFMSEVHNNIRGCEGVISIHMGYKDFTLEVRKTRLKNREFNNTYIIGREYEYDSSDVMTGDTCPECGHVIVESRVSWDSKESNGKYCSECDYEDEQFKAYRKKKEDDRVARKNAPPAAFMQSGLTVWDFAIEAGIDLDRKDRKWEVSCTVCGQDTVRLIEYGYSGGYASINCKCQNQECNNNCATVVPHSTDKKETWAVIGSGLFGEGK